MRHVSIGRPRGFASSAIRVPEQIRFDRLDHLVQPWTIQLKCACCGMKTKRRCSMCKVGIHDRCFIQFHTTWTVWFCACFFLVLNVMDMCFITVKLELLISNVMYCYIWRPNDWQYYLKAQHVTNMLHIINVCPKEFVSLNKIVFFWIIWVVIIIVNVEKKPYPFGTTIPYMGLKYFLFKINFSHKIIKINYLICPCYTKNNIISLIVSKKKKKGHQMGYTFQL